MVYHITTDELKRMTSADGLILQGCGGNPSEWLDGINKAFTELGILRNGDVFKDIHVFEHNELTNIMFDMENVDLDIGRLASWRMQTHDVYVGSWSSDYLANTLGVITDDSRTISVAPIRGTTNREYSDTIGDDNEPQGDTPPIVAFGERRSTYRDEGAEGPHPSDMENYDAQTHPLSVYVEKYLVPANGGFTMPLPASAEELRPFLDGIEISEWQDIVIIDIQSDIKSLGDKLQAIIAQEDMSPYRLNELNYLAKRIEDLDGIGYEIFAANIEAERNCGSIADMINLTFVENLNCFDVQPAFDEEMYGDFYLEVLSQDLHADAFNRLSKSDNPADRALAAYIETLEKHVDLAALGHTVVKEEDGVFTEYGYLTGGEGLRDFYHEPHDIPMEHRIYSPPMPMVQNVELSSLLMKMHALGGEYMQRADKNFSAFISRQSDELLLLTDGKDIQLMSTMSVYFKGTDEHNKWRFADAVKNPETRAFVVLPDDNGDKFAIGALVEIDFADQKRDILNNSIWPEQVEVVKKDGTEQLLSHDEWEDLSACDITNIVSHRRLYNESEISVICAHVDDLRSQCTANVKAISAEDLLANMNSAYMKRAECPRHDMLRVTREAATEILARGDADVYRLSPDGAQKLSPMDAVKTRGLWFPNNREFAIKSEDAAGLDKWAERKAGDIMRQAERGERSALKHRAEEL